MISKKKVVFVGGGNMGFALAKAFSKDEALEIQVFDVNQDLEEKYKKENIYFSVNKEEILENADYVFLAVKPQVISQVSREIKNLIPKKSIIISILAGVSLKTLSSLFEKKEIIRTMPNMPAMKGEGMIIWTSKFEIKAKEKSFIKELFLLSGDEIYVNQELMIDSATAISGSGPAYFFLFLESLKEAAQKFGFTEKESRKLALQTGIGSMEIAKDEDFKLLIKKIASPGGTTEKALETFEDLNLKGIVFKAAESARKRAKEISKNEK